MADKDREPTEDEMHEGYPKILLTIHAYAVVNKKMVVLNRQVNVSALAESIVDDEISPDEFCKEHGTDMMVAYTRIMKSLAKEAYEARQDYRRALKEELE